MTTHQSLERWIVRPQPQPHAQLRLFCLTYVGGGAAIFRTWPKQLRPEIEVCAIQLPGRESRLREPAYTRLEPLIDTLAEVVRNDELLHAIQQDLVPHLQRLSYPIS